MCFDREREVGSRSREDQAFVQIRALKTKSTPAFELIAKQKQGQTVQEHTRKNEKCALCYASHVEILPMPQPSLAGMVMA
jgi:hypothetical protein